MNRKQFIAYSAAIGSGLLFDSNRILADTLSGLSNKSKRKLVLFSLAGGIRFQDLWLMKDLFDYDLGMAKRPSARPKKGKFISNIFLESVCHKRNWEELFGDQSMFDELANRGDYKYNEMAFVNHQTIPNKMVSNVNSNKIFYKEYQDVDSVYNETISLMDDNKFHFIVCRINSFDVCHYNYTIYKNNLINSSQRINEIIINNKDNNTIFVVISEMGRNLYPNEIIDTHGEYGYDHFDENAKQTWALIINNHLNSKNVEGLESDSTKLRNIITAII